MKRSALASLLALSFAASCTTYSPQSFVGTADYDVLRRSTPDGARETFRLTDGSRLTVLREYDRERPFLGFKLQEIDKACAQRLSLDPYQGLLVTDTWPDSAARDAGIRAQDVLVRVDGTAVGYLEQFEEIERLLRGGQEVVVELLREGQELRRTLQTKLLLEQVTDRESVPLRRGPGSPRPHAGVNLLGVPPPWCERMFGDDRNAVFISTVEVGSPAWLAGFRGGDLIERVDGAPVPPVEQLSRQIAALGEAERTMTWQVRREEGQTYESRIHLSDYSGTGGFHIPLLFSVQDGTDEDKFRLGMGLIMGNRHSYVADSTTRRIKTRNRFSALLGLIQVDAAPDETRVRLLWFITFET